MKKAKETWQEFIDDVNDVLENPLGACQALELLDPPMSCGKITRQLVQDVMDRLDEMPGGCFDFPTLKECSKMEQSILDGIRDQLGNAWCDCGTEEITIPPCANAGGTSTSVIDSYTRDIAGFGETPSDAYLGNASVPAELPQLLADYSAALDEFSILRLDPALIECEIEENTEALADAIEAVDQAQQVVDDSSPPSQAALDNLVEAEMDMAMFEQILEGLQTSLGEAQSEAAIAEGLVGSTLASALAVIGSRGFVVPSHDAAPIQEANKDLAGCSGGVADFCRVGFALQVWDSVSGAVERATTFNAITGVRSFFGPEFTSRNHDFRFSRTIANGFFDPFSGDAVGSYTLGFPERSGPSGGFNVLDVGGTNYVLSPSGSGSVVTSGTFTRELRLITQLPINGGRMCGGMQGGDDGGDDGGPGDDGGFGGGTGGGGGFEA